MKKISGISKQVVNDPCHFSRLEQKVQGYLLQGLDKGMHGCGVVGLSQYLEYPQVVV